MSPIRSAYWDQRLYNWALWAVGGGTARISAFVVGDRYIEEPPRPPLPLVGEALDTDDLVLKLTPKKLVMAVRARYVWSGSIAERAAYLGCHVDTLRNRVNKAKSRLDELDAERHRRLVKPPKAKSPLDFSVLVLQIG